VLNLAGITICSGRFPGRDEYLVDNFRKTGIALVECMKLNETRGTLRVQQETTHVIRNRFVAWRKRRRA